MLETYKAVLRGDKIEWESDAPKILEKEKRVEVFVTILNEETIDSKLRPFGLSAGEFVVPDDFDAPLPDEIAAAFER
ncbi:MAG: type II toxin-antitoxin system Phd/YefM family antitoxin [Acidobacteriota bacterium]|nr:type II toxin-antitoxin system Phd/YefM family antitoxin [Acidobacteriota bacterium]